MRLLGVIPAAGRSTRMGSPKPLLDTGRGSFLARVAGALREGGVREVVVGVRDERSPIAAEAARVGAEVFVPPDLEEGPIATLREAIRRREPDALVLHPVDHPLVEGATVAALVAAAAGDPDAHVVVPVLDGRTGHPVLLRRDLFAELLEPELPEGARTVVRRDRDRVLEVPVADRGILADLNTLADYRRHFPGPYRKRFQKW